METGGTVMVDRTSDWIVVGFHFTPKWTLWVSHYIKPLQIRVASAMAGQAMVYLFAPSFS